MTTCMITESKETTALRCPYCKRAMVKFWEMSRWWNCDSCKSVFNESDFSNKIWAARSEFSDL